LKQEAPSRKRKRGSDTTNQQEDKLQALRERLKELKAKKNASAAKPSRKTKTSATAHKASGNDAEEDQDKGHGLSSDPDSDSDSEQPAHARSSKHAPATQSSKRAVTRKRTVVEVKKPVVRDPRFDPLTGPRPDEAVLKKRYSFLNGYKSSEMAELRAIIKKTKNEAEKEVLKRKLLSMESQQKAQAGKEKQQEIVREHRKKERELVKQGKKPFFLKKCEFRLAHQQCLMASLVPFLIF
jgi:ribosomal RNA-processing protein 36